MQIVIDIPENIFNTIQADEMISREQLAILQMHILNGTPLPKGHGKIIDYGYVVDAIDDWINAEEYRYTNATDYLRKRVANAPTIIEADKAESEGKE